MVNMENSFRHVSQPRLIVGNWKMHGGTATLAELAAIDGAAAEMDGTEVVMCLPATLIGTAAARVRHLALGGQDCHAEAKGAFTGSVSAEMLADAGAKWVIVGHSECRLAQRAANRAVAAKADAAIAAGLRVILCVGEARRADPDAAVAAVARQLVESLPSEVPPALVIAYEPVWAIGSGETPSLAQIAAMHAGLRRALTDAWGAQAFSARFLYGGSVDRDNARRFQALDGVDGLLVGRASLTADALIPILPLAVSGT
jgi:triosephosphate isomerase